MVVWGKTIDEPSDFNVSQTFFFKSSAAADPIEISIEVDFEKDLELKRRPTVEMRVGLFGFLFGFVGFSDEAE